MLHPLKRNAEGNFERISSEQALDEIAARLDTLIRQYGPDAIGVYFGNGSIFNSTAVTMQAHFLEALGSRSRFTSYTIDQSAKTLSFERLGGWAGGSLQLEQSDVVMLDRYQSAAVPRPSGLSGIQSDQTPEGSQGARPLADHH
ncbi:TPA: molybdopterin-dependent oxidoreductase [Pseudomonas aeruginosa]